MPQKRVQHPRFCAFDILTMLKMLLKTKQIKTCKICSKIVKIGGLMADHMFYAWSDTLTRISSLFFSSCLVRASTFAWALLSLNILLYMSISLLDLSKRPSRWFFTLSSQFSQVSFTIFANFSFRVSHWLIVPPFVFLAPKLFLGLLSLAFFLSPVQNIVHMLHQVRP